MTRRDLRLSSGLVLFAYLTLHLVCHACGLVSLDAAESALQATLIIWHSLAGSILLYGAAMVHVGLALLAVYDRRTLRMAPDHALRLVLGLTMPLALIGHFVGTRYAFERFGLPADYHRVVANLWTSDGRGRQLAVLVPGWLHGCLGLNFAFRHVRLWQRLRTVLFGVALLLPVLAGLGFLAMGRDLAGGLVSGAQVRTEDRTAALDRAAFYVLIAYLVAIGLVVSARIVRGACERWRRSVVDIAYPSRTISVPRGWTVLEASRSFGIPHLASCGGRARCSTCRVKVISGEVSCPSPSLDERRALARIGAGSDVRLACQLRPANDISVLPLLTVDQRFPPTPDRQTNDREVAVMFLEVRFASRDDVSPHDAIYVLERFQAFFTSAIDEARGLPCRQTGTSWTALFGIGDTAADGCPQAIEAARRIETCAAVEVARLARELGLHVAFSVGVHVGPVVAKILGEGVSQSLTAFGDALFVTDLLQAASRACGERLVISQAAGAKVVGIGAAWRVLDGSVGRSGIPVLWTRLPSRTLR